MMNKDYEQAWKSILNEILSMFDEWAPEFMEIAEETTDKILALDCIGIIASEQSEMIAQQCLLCQGTGEMLLRPSRFMGYTFGPDENIDALEERLIPCSDCTLLSQSPIISEQFIE